MELWLTESHTGGYSVNWKVKETLYTEQTAYQQLAVIETYEFGRALVLDGVIQTTIEDEYVYHEMIALPAMFTHPCPKKVLVVGGGDGGTIREVLRCPFVEQVDLVEIDERVILASQKYFPEISHALTNPKVRIFIEDGLAFVKRKKEQYDVILIDSSDPVGPAENLFHEQFYIDVYQALNEDGLMVCQSESPLYYKETLANVHNSLRKHFKVTRTYLTAVPTYVSGFWSFTLGSKKHDPLEVQLNNELIDKLDTKYYNSAIHRAAFVLPNNVAQLFK